MRILKPITKDLSLSLGIFIIGTLVFFFTYYMQQPINVQISLAATPGDCDGDGYVDLFDYGYLSRSFGLTQGQAGFDGRCDFHVDQFNIIDLFDYQILANNFGRTGPSTTPPNTSTPIPTGSGNSAVVAAAGDIVCGVGSTGAACKQMATSDLVVAMHPNAVVILGDNQYEEGVYSDFQNYYQPSWGRFKNITRPAVGNHEYLTSGASGYFDYFNGVGNTTGPAGDRGKGYYAFNVGAWRLYALNTQLCGGMTGSGCARTSEQARWFLQDLQQSIQAGIRCQVAYFHHPLWTSGSRASPSTRPLYEIMYEQRVELALAGHEHNYERFAPMDANGTAVSNGVRELVVGTGGRNFTAFTHTQANSQVRNATTFGVLKMTLNPGSYNLNFVPIAGSSFTDSLTNQSCN